MLYGIKKHFQQPAPIQQQQTKNMTDYRSVIGQTIGLNYIENS